MKKQLLIFINFVLWINCLNAQENYLILVSFDGFRWDYCSKAETPAFDSITKYGVKAVSLQPSFPTKTFPNHYTIVTGLYPDNHGIVNNSFYSPKHNETYRIGNRKAVENGSYYSGTPIWNLAESQGVKSASFFWVGSEAPIEDSRPSYWKSYQHDFPFEQRVDTVISWLMLPKEKRPRLILLYFHEPDSKGHKFGPDSKELKETVQRLDTLLNKLFNGLKSLSYHDKINVIITSDHGMAEIEKDKTINLQNYLKDNWVDRVVGGNPTFNIWAKNGYEDSVLMALDTVAHLNCWKNNEIPSRLNYGKNKRTGTHIVVSEIGWSLQYKKGYYSTSKGAHGYDNEDKDMHAIFYAIGPSFKVGFQSETFQNVDIYPLIAYLLKLKTPKIDGKFERISNLPEDN